MRTVRPKHIPCSFRITFVSNFRTVSSFSTFTAAKLPFPVELLISRTRNISPAPDPSHGFDLATQPLHGIPNTLSSPTIPTHTRAHANCEGKSKHKITRKVKHNRRTCHHRTVRVYCSENTFQHKTYSSTKTNMHIVKHACTPGLHTHFHMMHDNTPTTQTYVSLSQGLKQVALI